MDVFGWVRRRAPRQGECHQKRVRTSPTSEPACRGASTGSSDKRFALADEGCESPIAGLSVYSEWAFAPLFEG